MKKQFQIKITLNEDDFNKSELEKHIIHKLGELNRSLYMKNLIRKDLKNSRTNESYLMKLKIQLTCYLILIASICFTGLEIFKTLNNLQNNYIQNLEILKDA